MLPWPFQCVNHQIKQSSLAQQTLDITTGCSYLRHTSVDPNNLLLLIAEGLRSVYTQQKERINGAAY